jgi:hypothetical protein
MHSVPCKSGRDSAEGPHFSSCNLSIIIDLSQSDLHRVYQMRGECDDWSFRKIPRTESEVRLKTYYGLEVKCHSWRIATKFIPHAEHEPESARCGVSVTSLQWTARHRRETTLVVYESALHYWPISSKLALFVAHSRWVRRCDVSVTSLQRRAKYRRKTTLSQSKVPFIIDRIRPNV